MMGVVYRALDPALGRSVALKTVGLSFAVPEDERASFEQRFMAEARVAAGLSQPGIVVVHDVGPLQNARRAQGQEIRSSGSGADEINLAHQSISPAATV